MNTIKLFHLVSLLLQVLGIGVMTVSAQPADQPVVIKYEVAEDGNRFKFDDLNLFEDGMPGYGSAFVTQGYIYPVGTLNGTNGAFDDGKPEFLTRYWANGHAMAG